MSDWVSILAASWGLAVALSAALFALGMRGRRVDDHPLCRRCGFDLTGRAPTTPQCTECGADLVSRKAIRTGHRARRPAMIVMGLLSLLFFLAAGGTVGYVSLTQSSYYDRLPAWVLGWIATDGPSGSMQQTTAINELLRRISSNQASEPELHGMVDRILQRERVRTPTSPWLPGWGDLIIRMRRDGILTPGDWDEFLSHLYTVDAFYRPVATPRQPYVIGYRLAETCVLNKGDFAAEIVAIEYVWAGAPVAVKFAEENPFGRSSAFLSISYRNPFRKSLPTLFNLSHTFDQSTLSLLTREHGNLSARVRLRVYEPSKSASAGIERVLDVPLHIRVDPARETSMEPISDPRSISDFRSSLGKPMLEASMGQTKRLSFTLPLVAKLKHAVAFEVAVRDGDRSLGAAFVLAQAGTTLLEATFDDPSRPGRVGPVELDMLPPTATVLLRPKPAIAFAEPELQTYIDAEVRLDWVPIRIRSE